MPKLVSPNPICDVLIPVYNHAELVEDCIGRMDSTTSVPYKLTLIDDGSPDPKVREYLSKQITRATVLRNSQNLGFPQTVNKAARATYSKYLCILNSDCTPLPGWLDIMVEDLEKNPRHGVVGPLLLFSPNSQSGPGGRVAHAGMYFDIERVPYHRYIGWPADHKRVREYRDDLQAVTGACMLIRRSLWNDIGGFAKEYGRGTFEDVDFCLTAKHIKGQQIVYCPDAMLYHHVGGSARDPGAAFPLQVNYRIFLERAGSLAEYDEWFLTG